MGVIEFSSNTLSVVVLSKPLDDPVDECLERQFLSVGVGQYSKDCPASLVCDCREDDIGVGSVVCLGGWVTITHAASLLNG